MDNKERLTNMISALADGNDETTEIEFRQYLQTKIKTTLDGYKNNTNSDTTNEDS